jgi:hypothetical protein
MIGFQLLTRSIASASLLGVLKTAPDDGPVWPTVRASLRRYIWPLLILALLLSIIACLIVVPFSFLIAFFGIRMTNATYLFGFLGFLFAVLYLVFAKYALADPLVVVENMNPLAALGKSWRMTRGRFGYVIGSYVFVGTAEYFLTASFQHFEVMGTFGWSDAVDQVIGSLFACYWILLAWVMYVRIRESETTPPPVPGTIG